MMLGDNFKTSPPSQPGPSQLAPTPKDNHDDDTVDRVEFDRF